MSRISAGRKSTNGQLAVRVLQDYFFQSTLPLTILAFLLPLIAFYEVGTLIFARDVVNQTETRVLAFNYMRQFFAIFGLSGRLLPGLAVVGILFFWHLFRRDPWTIHAGATMGMTLESLFLAFPLLALGTLIRTYLPLYAPSNSLAGGVVLAVGAGVYEELVFRLIALTLLNILTMDLLRLKKRPAYLLIVVASSILFASYHYWSPQSGAFRWSDFTFRTLSGAYFGVLFITRGFGITAGTHASYDLYFFLLRSASGR
jgi:hypothetical protein